MSDVDQIWQDFWVPIVMPHGSLDVEQVKRELFDYHALIDGLPRLYSEITGGMVSKPNTDIDAVLSVAHERFTEEFARDVLHWLYRVRDDYDGKVRAVLDAVIDAAIREFGDPDAAQAGTGF